MNLKPGNKYLFYTHVQLPSKVWEKVILSEEMQLITVYYI
jgi:hypothetical protein